MIGCGGAGNKVVRYARDAVVRRLKEAGWDQGVPHAWQFIGVDSHGSLDDPSIPFLPQSDFVNLANQFNSYQMLNYAIEAMFGLHNQQANQFQELIGWRPNPYGIDIPLRDSSGQFRSVGRIAALLSMQRHLQDRIREAFQSCEEGGGELSNVSRALGVEVPPGQPVSNPIVMVVGSIAGGDWLRNHVGCH